MKRRANKRSAKAAHSRLVKKWDGTPVFAAPASVRPSVTALRARLDANPGDRETRLALAEVMLERGKPDETLTLLKKTVATAHADAADTPHWQAVCLAAIAKARLGEYDQARALAVKGLEVIPDALDLHYILAYIGQRQDDYILSETHARRFVVLLPDAGSETDQRLRRTAGQAHEVQNYLGIALEKTGDCNGAMEAYEGAIALRRNFGLAWANLIRLLESVGRRADASAVLREARKACPRSKALAGLIAAPGTRMPDSVRRTLAVCMIVKNEQEHLPRCLTSVKALVDEIVVVDTGSTDRTVEIAKSFGARVYHHAWEGNFSKARNISIGYAESDWILILDADEEIETDDLGLIRQTVASAEFKAIAVSVYNYSAQKRMYTSFLPSIRLFRRDLGAFYEGIVHNQLRFPSLEGVLRIPARINHYGYGLAPEIMERKIARTKGLLQKQLRENPDNGFAHFNMAQLLRGEENKPTPEMMDRVIYHAGRAVDLSSPDSPQERHIHLMALHQLVTAYFNKGDYEKAAVHAHRALSHKRGYLDAVISLGHIHSMDGRLDLARQYYLEYLDRQIAYDEHAETDHVILLHLRSRHNALYGLGLIAEMQNNAAEAAQWYERCISERDDYLDVHLRLARMHQALGDLQGTRRELEREIACHPACTEARLALAGILENSGDFDQCVALLEAGQTHDQENPELILRLAGLDFKRGEFDRVLTRLRDVPEHHPLASPMARLAADALYETSRFDEAAAQYERVIAFGPSDWDAVNNLGNCRFRLGDFDQAERLYRRVIDAGRAGPSLYRNLGVSLARQEKVDDAIFALESYATLNPADIEASGFLGDLYYRQRDYLRAIDQYEKVVEQQPSRPDTLTRLGDCYLNRGALAAALAGYESALNADPEYQPAWSRLHDIRAQLASRIQTAAPVADDLAPGRSEELTPSVT